MIDAPICLYCKRYRRDDPDRLTCDAFPAGIPETIIESRLDHRKPVNGDRGLRFDPVDADGERYASAVFSKSAGD